MFQLENFRGIICHDIEGRFKILKELTCSLKNDIRTWVNCHASIRKSENLDFDWILLSIAYKEIDEKI